MGFILPYVEQDSLWSATEQAFLIDRRAFHNPPHIGYATVVKVYVCTADGRLFYPLTDKFGVTAAYTDYIGIRRCDNAQWDFQFRSWCTLRAGDGRTE